MTLGEWLAAVGVLLLSLYGCAQLIRRVCLWIWRCPRNVRCYRLAVPRDGGAIEPLFRCLQAQDAWADAGAQCTMVLMPPLDEARQLVVDRLIEENPSVVAVTAAELAAMVAEL
ncbi:MAG: hypothetical protein IJB26_05385 [Clostridia bacterium]|nr:hypothetical protein [Clostridia bacterium]